MNWVCKRCKDREKIIEEGAAQIEIYKKLVAAQGEQITELKKYVVELEAKNGRYVSLISLKGVLNEKNMEV